MLNEDCPIYYKGIPINPPGHAFVCDGYQDADYFHFNLGWGGQDNGYYTIDNIVGFNYNQEIRTTLCPDTLQFNYPTYATGSDTLRAFEGNITDGSGPVNDYLNNTLVSWLIDPQNEMDSVTDITLYIKRCQICDGDYLRIYDGADNTAPVLAEVIGETYPEELKSTGNKIFVELTSDGENTAQGFHIDYHCEVPTFCSGQEMLTESIKRFNDGSGLFYYQNNNNCMWLLQPEGCDSSLTLYFDYFDTEAEKDILQIYNYETQELLAEYSGRYEGTPEPVVSPCGKMLLLFMTNKSERGQGWSAYYGDFTGIDEQEKSLEFRLYPNPCKDGLELYFPLPPVKLKEMLWGNSIQMYRALYKINNLRNRTGDALKYHVSYASAKDTLNKLQQNREIINLQTKHETERNEKQIDFLSQENALQELRLTQSRYFLLGLGGMVLLVIVLAIFIIRQNKLRDQQQKLLLQQKLFRSQMNPHFIFNSLTSIQNYIMDEEAHHASKYLSRFAKLIRNILDSSIEDFVPLEQEIGTIEHYLELQKIRFKDKFDYTLEVDEAINPENINIPPMLAQPFIENSIEHGIKHKKSKGHIHIRFYSKNSQVVCEVEDDGIGRQKAQEILYGQDRDHKSLATAITYERIRVLNKKLKRKITLLIQDLKDAENEPSGTKVILQIPII